MGRFRKPAEGSWTAHHPGLGTGRISFEDSISPEFHALEPRLQVAHHALALETGLDPLE